MLKLTVLSPERRVLESVQVQYVTLTGSEGQIQILPGHTSMVGTIETGYFSYETESDELYFGATSSGFFEVENDEVCITAETFEYSNELDLDRAILAQEKAEKGLFAPDLTPEMFRKYELKLQRALIRQQLASQLKSG